MNPLLRDRRHAGTILARKLAWLEGTPDLVVVALPLGGIPVACEIARALEAPLDICHVKKLGVPADPDQAMGAVGPGGVVVLDYRAITDRGVPQGAIEREIFLEREKIDFQESKYRRNREAPDLAGKTVIVVDDGISTGMTLEAALKAIRNCGPARIIAAVGVAPREIVWRVAQSIEIFTVLLPSPMGRISDWYQNFQRPGQLELNGQLAGITCAQDLVRVGAEIACPEILHCPDATIRIADTVERSIHPNGVSAGCSGSFCHTALSGRGLPLRGVGRLRSRIRSPLHPHLVAEPSSASHKDRVLGQRHHDGSTDWRRGSPDHVSADRDSSSGLGRE